MTGKASGYIPEGGVWTAEDRANIHEALASTRRDAYALVRGEATVAALVAALEDAHGPIRDSGGCVCAIVGQEPCAVCGLLDALK